MMLASRFAMVFRSLLVPAGSRAISRDLQLEVRAAQIVDIGQRSPFMAMLSAFAAWAMLQATADAAHMPLMAGLLAALIALYAATGLGVWLFGKTVRGRTEPIPLAVSGVVAVAAVIGCIWGVLSIILLNTAAADGLLLLTAMLTGGVLVTTFHFATLLPAMLAFSAVASALAGYGIWMRADPEHLPTGMALVAFYALFVPWYGAMHARGFIEHATNEVQHGRKARHVSSLLDQYQETSSEWYWEVDRNGCTRRISPRMCETLGIPHDAVVGADFVQFLTSRAVTGDSSLVRFAHLTRRGRAFSGLEAAFSVKGEKRWWRMSGRPRIVGGAHAGFIGTCLDITAEKHAELKITALAHSDALTGLYNRASFSNRLEASVRTLERFGTAFTLLFLDLDKFKLVNDTHGHPVGDKLLVEVAKRIRNEVRADDCVARLGGDEFAIIVDGNDDAVFVAKLASRLIASVMEPYHIDGEMMWIGVSVGIALAPQHGTQPEQILRNADLALYRAKEDGRGVFRYFEAHMDFEQRERRVLEREMHQALTNGEFRLCYQPVVSTARKRIVGVEALIRWDHPIRGEIAPDEFIHIAEQSNLIIDIGKWTLHEACSAALDWPDDISVSVNIAATHFMRSDIVADIGAIIDEVGFDPRRLEIEITESILIEDGDEVFGKLAALKRIGCSIVMDDFGTGYSSLSYLLRFPFDRLKIDRSFILDMESKPGSKAILQAVASLGENLGIDVTAEGVETAAQLAFVASIACDRVQGFYFARPMRREKINAALLQDVADRMAMVETGGPAAQNADRMSIAGH